MSKHKSQKGNYSNWICPREKIMFTKNKKIVARYQYYISHLKMSKHKSQSGVGGKWGQVPIILAWWFILPMFFGTIQIKGSAGSHIESQNLPLICGSDKYILVLEKKSYLWFRQIRTCVREQILFVVQTNTYMCYRRNPICGADNLVHSIMIDKTRGLEWNKGNKVVIVYHICIIFVLNLYCISIVLVLCYICISVKQGKVKCWEADSLYSSWCWARCWNHGVECFMHYML